MSPEQIEIKFTDEDREYYDTTMAAFKLWEEGKREDAVKLLYGLSEKFPDVPGVHQHLSEYLHELGARDKAYEHVEKAITLDPDGADPYVAKAKLIAMDGNFEGASSQLDVAFSKRLNMYFTYITAAGIFSRYGLHEQAQEIFEKGVSHIPDSPDIWKSYAKLHSQAFNLEAALDVLKRGVEANQFDKDLLFELAMLAGGLDRRDLAIPAIEQFRKLEPKNVLKKTDHLVNLSRMYMASNDIDSSEKAIREAIKLDKGDKRNYIQLASIMKFKGNKKEVEKAYKEAEKIDRSLKSLIETIKSSPPIRSYDVSKRGSALRHLQEAFEFLAKDDQQTFVVKLRDAMKASSEDWLLDTLVSSAKNDESRIGLLAVASMVIDAFGDKKKTVGAMHRALKISPENSELWKNYAISLIKINGVFGALEAVERARRLDPNTKDLSSLQGAILTKLQRFDEATKLLEEALKENPEDTNSLTYLIAGYIELEKFEEASEYVKKALTLDEKNPYYYGYYAKIEHRLGRSDNAKKALKECAKLDQQVAASFEKELK